ncbi:hypothetical protein M422DRAFT_258563 [Sphaerobolus stellatus SS14]|uniref:Unplaced genomic scaffold SPHSTscaffold_83, whole genome shotgun sequence n=1 Tax=Sphaerobolus stellatus (strain SS14) TaxID=990650 RepID=A0A0C9VAU9_SPHS4|nr:hypothetical protein M422DRAFT_258563 [Sphaerobolus stellatus SS14]
MESVWGQIASLHYPISLLCNFPFHKLHCRNEDALISKKIYILRREASFPPHLLSPTHRNASAMLIFFLAAFFQIFFFISHSQCSPIFPLEYRPPTENAGSLVDAVTAASTLLHSFESLSTITLDNFTATHVTTSTPTSQVSTNFNAIGQPSERPDGTPQPEAVDPSLASLIEFSTKTQQLRPTTLPSDANDQDGDLNTFGEKDDQDLETTEHTDTIEHSKTTEDSDTSQDSDTTIEDSDATDDQDTAEEQTVPVDQDVDGPNNFVDDGDQDPTTTEDPNTEISETTENKGTTGEQSIPAVTSSLDAVPTTTLQSLQTSEGETGIGGGAQSLPSQTVLYSNAQAADLSTSHSSCQDAKDAWPVVGVAQRILPVTPG